MEINVIHNDEDIAIDVVRNYLDLFKQNSEGFNQGDGEFWDITWYPAWNQLQHLWDPVCKSIKDVKLKNNMDEDRPEAWEITVIIDLEGNYMEIGYEEGRERFSSSIAFWINVHEYSLKFKIWRWCASRRYVPINDDDLFE